jgi:hypothetical protein
MCRNQVKQLSIECCHGIEFVPPDAQKGKKHKASIANIKPRR